MDSKAWETVGRLIGLIAKRIGEEKPVTVRYIPATKEVLFRWLHPTLDKPDAESGGLQCMLLPYSKLSALAYETESEAELNYLISAAVP